jgi:hypothetical protein
MHSDKFNDFNEYFNFEGKHSTPARDGLLTFPIEWLQEPTALEGLLPPLPGVVECPASYQSPSPEAQNLLPIELLEANPTPGPSSFHPHTITTSAALQMPRFSSPCELFEANLTAGPSSHTLIIGTAPQMPLFRPHSLFEANPIVGPSSLTHSDTIKTGTTLKMPLFSPHRLTLDFRVGASNPPPQKKRKKAQALRKRKSVRELDASVEEVPDWGSAIGWAQVFQRMREWMVRDLPIRPFWMNPAELEEAVRTALSLGQ